MAGLKNTGTATALLSNNWSSQIHGLATTNTLLVRALDSSIHMLGFSENEVALREQLLMERFTQPKELYHNVISVTQYNGLRSSLLFVELEAAMEENLQNIETPGALRTLDEVMGETRFRCEQLIGTMQRSVLVLMQKIATVRIQIFRQTVVDEYFENCENYKLSRDRDLGSDVADDDAEDEDTDCEDTDCEDTDKDVDKTMDDHKDGEASD